MTYIDYEVCPTCDHEKALYGDCENCAERLADPTPHTDPTAAAVRAAQAEALREAADDMDRLNHGEHRPPEPYLPAGTSGAIDWLRDRADRLATDTAAPESNVSDLRFEAQRWEEATEAGLVRTGTTEDGRAIYAAPVAVEGVETVETLAEVRLTDAELGDLAAAYGWWKAHGDPEMFYDTLQDAAARIVQARAGEGALREAVEDAVTAAWVTRFDTPPLLSGPDTYYAGVVAACTRVRDALARAALDPEATT